MPDFGKQVFTYTIVIILALPCIAQAAQTAMEKQAQHPAISMEHRKDIRVANLAKYIQYNQHIKNEAFNWQKPFS